MQRPLLDVRFSPAGASLSFWPNRTFACRINPFQQQPLRAVLKVLVLFAIELGCHSRCIDRAILLTKSCSTTQEDQCHAACQGRFISYRCYVCLDSRLVSTSWDKEKYILSPLFSLPLLKFEPIIYCCQTSNAPL